MLNAHPTPSIIYHLQNYIRDQHQQSPSSKHPQMWSSVSILFVSVSLLLSFAPFPAPCLADLQWPYDLPPHVKYYPEDERLVRRNLEAQERLETQSPVGVRKMSDDEGEMFFLEYWGFEVEGREEEGTDVWNNSSAIQPPFALHADPMPGLSPRFAKHLFAKRAFNCPSGTNSCEGIGRPNSCCPNGLTCNLITDSGLGDVGCCEGNSCAGQVVSCMEGYSPCNVNQGGGCCIPEYRCEGVGCKSLQFFVICYLLT